MRAAGRARRGTRATTACRRRKRVVPRDAGHRGQRVRSRLSGGERGTFASDTSPVAGNTQTMTGVPVDTLIHRWLGLHAPAMRRAVTVLFAGLIIGLALLPIARWGLALVGGWDAAALAFLLATWPVIIRAGSSRAAQLAAREDDTEGSARALLVGASGASLLGVGYTLHLAGRESGAHRVLLIGAAVLTVVLSWSV